jgi:hypothetical protein
MPLSCERLDLLGAYWRAANYLSVGQIYLHDNPLLREPLRLEHVKPRLLGHWGTTRGLNLLYVHLNRGIRERGLSMTYVTGPGHGGPGLIANTYLEGTQRTCGASGQIAPQASSSPISLGKSQRRQRDERAAMESLAAQTYWAGQARSRALPGIGRPFYGRPRSVGCAR